MLIEAERAQHASQSRTLRPPEAWRADGCSGGGHVLLSPGQRLCIQSLRGPILGHMGSYRNRACSRSSDNRGLFSGHIPSAAEVHFGQGSSILALRPLPYFRVDPLGQWQEALEYAKPESGRHEPCFEFRCVGFSIPRPTLATDLDAPPAALCCCAATRSAVPGPWHDTMALDSFGHAVATWIVQYIECNL